MIINLDNVILRLFLFVLFSLFLYLFNSSNYILLFSLGVVYTYFEFLKIKKIGISLDFFFYTLISFYFIIGSANISGYRGEVTEWMYFHISSFMLLMFISYKLGTGLSTSMNLGWIKEKVEANGIINFKLIMLSSIPGFIGLMIMLPTGIPLIQSDKFTLVSPKAYFFLEMFFVTFIFCLNNYLALKNQNAKLSRFYLNLTILCFILLSLPGYRGWILICCFLIFYATYEKPGRITVTKILIIASLGALVLGGLAVYRRIVNPELTLASDALINYEAEHLGEIFAFIHFSLRESITISQTLIENGIPPSYPLFLSDFLTILPNYDMAGGKVIAHLFSEYSGVGLTPGALGALIIEFGYFPTILVIFLSSFIVGFIGRLSKAYNNYSFKLFSLLLLIYYIHYLHRGIPKPAYLFVPLLFMFFFALNIIRGKK